MKRILLIAAGIPAVMFFLNYISGKTSNVTHGFICYYATSRVLIEENDFSKTYDTLYLNAKIRDYGIDNVRDISYNPPSSALMMLPLVNLKPADAKIVWTALNVLFYLASILLLLRIFNIKYSSETGLLLIIISFLFLPVYRGFNLGQAYVFLLLLFSLSLYGLKKENDWLAAIPLAMIIVLKGYGFFPLLALGFLKKWKALSIVIITAIIIILITMPFTGINSWSIFFNDVILKTGNNPHVSNTAYQTLNSFTRHVFMLNTVPVFIILLITAVTAIYFLKKKNTGNMYSALLIYSSFAALNILFAPIAEDYHYALLLPVIFGTGKIIFDIHKYLKTEAVFFAVSLFIISAPLNYKSLQDASFPLILLAYPVLYGGVLLIILSNRLHNTLKHFEKIHN